MYDQGPSFVLYVILFLAWLIPLIVYVVLLGGIKRKLEDIELVLKGEARKPGH